MITLKDIAKKAGVTVSTVSKALNGNSDIADETREMIQSIATELNYRPNIAAQTLAGKASKLIGIIVPEIESNYFVKIVCYLEEVLQSKGYSPILAISNFELQEECDALELFCNRNVDGVFLVCPMHSEIRNYLAHIKSSYGIPVVIIEALTHLPDCDYVMIDDTYGMTMAVKYLMEKGHQKIGFITDSTNTAIRLPMFQEAMSKNGLAFEEQYFKSDSERFEQGGYNCMKEILIKKDRPTALLTGYDDIAIGAMRAIYEAGLKIPEDIAIVGNDNIRESSFLYQGLTTISPPVREMARMGVDLLIEKIKHNENTVIHNIKLKPELIIRETT